MSLATTYTPSNPITYDFVTHVAEYTHCCEASDLGLRAGQWPEVIACDPQFGNGCVLIRERQEWRDGELASVMYRQALGVIKLRVFND